MESGNDTVSGRDSPGSNETRTKATRRCGGIGVAEAARTGLTAGAGRDVCDQDLVHLTYLLGQGHLAQQVVDTLADRRN